LSSKNGDVKNYSFNANMTPYNWRKISLVGALLSYYNLQNLERFYYSMEERWTIPDGLGDVECEYILTTRGDENVSNRWALIFITFFFLPKEFLIGKLNVYWKDTADGLYKSTDLNYTDDGIINFIDEQGITISQDIRFTVKFKKPCPMWNSSPM
jgi:hypothetical protein